MKKYYVVRLTDIPEEGTLLEASIDRDKWFREMLSQALTLEAQPLQAALRVYIEKNNKTVDITGEVHVTLDIACSRCLKGLNFDEKIPLRFLMEPAPEDARRDGTAVDKREEMDEALDFSYYTGGQFDLGDLIRQHIVMDQPISFLCRPDCKGLCGTCGKNLNEGPCGCVAEPSPSPFAVLKRLKKR